jgi:hypothetical protein
VQVDTVRQLWNRAGYAGQAGGSYLAVVQGVDEYGNQEALTKKA